MSDTRWKPIAAAGFGQIPFNAYYVVVAGRGAAW